MNNDTQGGQGRTTDDVTESSEAFGLCFILAICVISVALAKQLGAW